MMNSEHKPTRSIKKPFKQEPRVASVGRGGPRVGSGKKPRYAEGAMSPYSIAITKSMRDKIDRNGGPEWFRNLIETADDVPANHAA